MVCRTSEYELHTYADQLRDNNLFLYWLKYIIFYCKVTLDHWFARDHIHDIEYHSYHENIRLTQRYYDTDEVFQRARDGPSLDEWIAEPLESVWPDVWEIVLLVLFLIVFALLVRHLLCGISSLVKYTRMSTVDKKIREYKRE